MRRVVGLLGIFGLLAIGGLARGDVEAGAQPSAGESARARLKALELKVQALKEKVSQVERHAAGIRERVLGTAGVTTIRQANRLGRSFRLLQATYVLDGHQIFARKDKGGDLDVRDLDVLQVRLQPGAHTLAVVLRYRGHGYGVFDYFNKYRFTIKESYTFTVAVQGETRVVVEAYERGDATTPMAERPASRLVTESAR
jgi:hypothetical protein